MTNVARKSDALIMSVGSPNEQRLTLRELLLFDQLERAERKAQYRYDVTWASAASLLSFTFAARCAYLHERTALLALSFPAFFWLMYSYDLSVVGREGRHQAEVLEQVQRGTLPDVTSSDGGVPRGWLEQF